jgi:pimeloyl-ACP methyl ester carboxylesterase
VTAPGPTGWAPVGDGRRLAYDDTGDPDGWPVVYLHGFPDSRLSRHPDDGVAVRAGVRLLAVDRPGFGASDADGGLDYRHEADAVIALLDHLGVAQAGALGWSSGGPLALACGARHPERFARIGVIAGNPPVGSDAELTREMDELFAARGDVVAELGVEGFAAMVAPLAAIPGLDPVAARDLVREGRGSAYLADLATVPGLEEQLAVGAVAALPIDLTGAVEDLRRQVSPWGFELADVAVPVHLWYGTEDAMFRPGVGQWLAARLPHADLHVVDGGSHLCGFTHWSEILTTLRP